jgi:hypothetical protein
MSELLNLAGVVLSSPHFWQAVLTFAATCCICRALWMHSDSLEKAGESLADIGNEIAEIRRDVDQVSRRCAALEAEEAIRRANSNGKHRRQRV